MLQNSRYDAFGKTIAGTGTVDNKYLFAGEQYDPNLGDYYLRQRYYNSNTGRFTRRDSYEGRLGEPLTLHKYIYANNNPANGIDPSGLFTISLGDLSLAQKIDAILITTALVGSVAKTITHDYDPDPLGGFNEGNRPRTVLDGLFAWKSTWTPEPLGGFEGIKPSFSEHTGHSIGDIEDFVVFIFPYDTAPLIRNMKDADRTIPDGYAAHHIVAGRHQSFDEARIVLAEKGIDLQEEVNGAVLYNKPGYYNSHQGRGLHSRRAANRIIERIQELTPDEARQELKRIGKEMESGTFSF